MADVTDATFQTEVLDRSLSVPVVVDLWAPWCGPCRTLGPMLEETIGATGGAVELAKVNVDENPQVAASFRVQSIPAVFAVQGGQVVDGFIGAVPKPQVQEFISRLVPAGPSEVDLLVGAGDEESLRKALDIERDNPGAVVALAKLLVERGEPDDALELLGRVPETSDVRAVAAQARLSSRGVPSGEDVTRTLDELLGRVRDDEDARQEFLDLLETLGPDDPRTADYRRALASRLF
ncbi:MAG TPA: tetratricopeptide repeat protein [Acidimicrobiales bacterium]|nr:tetratricopeptide repeat protein [Acidimicrobiales bacterium]